MHATRRGGSSFALVEALEGRELLAFDPSKVGAVWAGSHSWKAEAGAPDYFIENQSIGYVISSLNGTLPATSYAKGGDPWSYVPGGRYQFKNGAGIPIGTLTVRNLQSMNVTVEKYWAQTWDEKGLRTGLKGKWNGVHTDGIYIENEKGLDPQSVLVFEDVDLTEISGGQGILWEGGSARRMYFKGVNVRNDKIGISGRIMLKVDERTRFHEMIFSDVSANVIFQVNGGRLADALGKVYVHDLSGAQLEAIRAELARKGFPVNDPTRFITGLPDDLVDARGVPLSRPFHGRPVSVGWSTTIPASEYDNGQEGLAYHDTSSETGGGGRYRVHAKKNPDAVDILSDGKSVRMVAGEWMDYTIDVRASAVYDVRALAAAGGGAYRIEFDGIQTTGNVATGDGARVFLPKGVHVMRLVARSGAFDVEGIDLSRRTDRVRVSGPGRLSGRSVGWGALDTPAGAPPTYASAINISWDDAGGEREYLIERRLEKGGEWKQVGTAAADVTSFADHGLWESEKRRSGIEPGAVYEYRVVAVDDAGDRYASKPLRVRAGSPTVTAAPRTPELLEAKARASGSVLLQWVDRSRDERGFRIERSTDPTFADKAIIDGRTQYLSYDLEPVGANVSRYVDRGTGQTTAFQENLGYRLRPGQTYYYRVTAYNSFGWSAPSEVMAVTIAPDLDVPAAATSVTAAPAPGDSGGVVITWEQGPVGPGQGGSVSGFRIERRREGSGASWHVLGAVEGDVRRFTDVALRTTNIVNHEYRVVAVNAAGDAPPSASANARVPRSQAVNRAPDNLRTTAFSGSAIRIEWDDGCDNEAGFLVERSLDGRNWMVVGVVGADEASFEDDGLISRTVYYYRVRGFNTNDTEKPAGYSNAAKGRTLAASKIIEPNRARRITR